VQKGGNKKDLKKDLTKKCNRKRDTKEKRAQ
jgi:hypothetical protein